jgi:hypothetical protein
VKKAGKLEVDKKPVKCSQFHIVGVAHFKTLHAETQHQGVDFNFRNPGRAAELSLEQTYDTTLDHTRGHKHAQQGINQHQQYGPESLAAAVQPLAFQHATNGTTGISGRLFNSGHCLSMPIYPKIGM